MKKRSYILSLILIMLLSVSPVSALGMDSPTFYLVLSDENLIDGEDIKVSVIGENLQDMFGFEMRLEFDMDKLHIKTIKSDIPGFSIPIQKRNNSIVFAHTKIGKNTNGESGRLELAEITFERLADGIASLQLIQVKLVNSKFAATEIQSNAQVEIVSGSIKDNSVQEFTDVSNHWAKSYIENATALGFVNGYPDGTFRPDEFITRAEFAAILVRAIPMPVSMNNPPVFIDFPNIASWAQPYVSIAASAGIVIGYEDHMFHPERRITRSEMTVMAVRTQIIDSIPDLDSNFVDADIFPTWAYKSIVIAEKEGLVQGKGKGIFDPNVNATRAESVKLILSLYDYHQGVK